MTPDEVARRARRWQLHYWRHRHWKLLGSRGARDCMSPLDGPVVAHVSDQATVHVRGVKRCGSSWVCTVCGPTVRSRRARDIDHAVEWWLDHGREVWFITVTVPHCAPGCVREHVHGHHRLRALRQQLSGMWSDMWQGEAGKALREAESVEYRIVAPEITYGSNGWHPHLHGLLFVRPGFDPVQVARRWRQMFERNGIGDRYVPSVSVELHRYVPGDEMVGEYLLAADTWGAGLELARADLKSNHGVTAAAILELASTGEKRWVARWCEYEAATKGWHSVRWSPGLRDLVGLDAERTDADLAASDDAGEVVATVITPAAVWAGAIGSGSMPALLVALVTNRGHAWGCHTVTSSYVETSADAWSSAMLSRHLALAG